MTAFIATTVWVERGLAERSMDDAWAGEFKVWSTRGLVLEGPEITSGGMQNSIEAIERAFESGAKGVEVDVFYDVEMGDFVVSHDRPYNRKKGALLTLDVLLDAVGPLGDFWLDWKKVRHLEFEERQDALRRLDELTSVGDLKQRFYIEAEDPFSLTQCKRAGFLTIYDTHPLPDANPVGSVLLDVYKAVYFFGGFDVLSMESGTPERRVFGERARRALRRVPLFLYHVPAEEDFLREALGVENVRVVLPRDQSLDLFDRRG